MRSRSVIRWFLLSCVIAFAMPAPAAAQGETPIGPAPGAGESGAEYIGGVGDLVAAALQTRGLFDQAKVLSEARDFLYGVGALAYLIAISMAVASVALYGSYRRAAYLLLGPTLFFFVIEARMTVRGTERRVGDRRLPLSIPDQRSFFHLIGQEYLKDGAEISYVFGVFDSLVTEVVQDLVAAIIDTASGEDMRRVWRERAFSWVMHSTAVDPGLASLVSHGIVGECSELAGRLLTLGRRIAVAPPAEKPKIEAEKAEVMVLWRQAGRVPLNENELTLLRRHAALLNLDPNNMPTAISCEQLQFLIRDLCRHLAEHRLDPRSFAGPAAPPDTTIPWGKAFDDVRAALGGGPGGTLNGPVDVLAAYILYNTATRNTHGAFTHQVFSRVGFSPERLNGIFGQVAHAEKYGGYLKMVYFAGAVPYVQGLLLYLLTLTFPFFSILLVIPSRARSFFVWMSLWVWVKSWDVGFAFVQVARGFLWQFVSAGLNRDLQKIDWEEPWTIFALVFRNDPLARENTYWQIVSLLTVSVPFITAHCCFGATNLYEAFKNSIDQVANRYGEQGAKAARRMEATKLEIELNKRITLDAVNEGNRALDDALAGRAVDFQGRNLAQMGDASPYMYAFSRYQQRLYENLLSEDAQKTRAQIAALTGRRSSGNASMATAQLGINAHLSYLNTSLLGRETLANTKLPFVHNILEFTGALKEGSVTRAGNMPAGGPNGVLNFRNAPPALGGGR